MIKFIHKWAKKNPDAEFFFAAFLLSYTLKTEIARKKCFLSEMIMVLYYCSHSSQTFTVWLRKKVIQVVIFASQSELSCKNHELLLTE